MEIKFTITKVMDDMGFCYTEVHFALGSPSNNKGKNWKVHYVSSKAYLQWGAFMVKGASGPQVQVLLKDYVFSSLKHGFHVLNKAHY
jgi:hypothetical protein